MDIETALQWFESVCEELQRSPGTATQKISEFRENFETAFPYSHVFFERARTPFSQFQALLILQYALLKGWDRLTTEDHNRTKELVWSFIVSSRANAAIPLYSFNKAVQTYALIWKRGWNES